MGFFRSHFASFLENFHPKNHGISKLLVWRSKRALLKTELKSPLFWPLFFGGSNHSEGKCIFWPRKTCCELHVNIHWQPLDLQEYYQMLWLFLGLSYPVFIHSCLVCQHLPRVIFWEGVVGGCPGLVRSFEGWRGAIRNYITNRWNISIYLKSTHLVGLGLGLDLV